MLTYCTLPPCAHAQQTGPAQLNAVTRARVDSLFAEFDQPTTPGCALLVRHKGVTAYSRGYGLASLELGVPNSPATVMDVGSMSKQFTAAAVLLLERQGKLSLHDDVRKWVPELPRLGHRVTLRDLLHHTSGWRDYTDILLIDGVREEAVATAADALRALGRQRALNFDPGTDFAYSNTGYFLLGQVVERVSGQSMRHFLREQIFRPLGMTHSDVFDDHRRVFPRRASSYAPVTTNEWNLISANWEQTGDGAIQTSVDDLALWDANLENPKSGWRPLVDSLQKPGRLKDGTPITYAGGLFVERVRGVRRLRHNGAWAGYRAAGLRYPDLATSIYLTCNAGNALASMLAERVAEVVLGDAMGPPDRVRLQDSVRVATLATAPELQQLLGTWRDPLLGGVLVIEARGDTLVTGSPLGRGRRALGRFADGTLVSYPVVDDAARWQWDSALNRIAVTLPVGTRSTFERGAPAPKLERLALFEYVGRFAAPDVGRGVIITVARDTLFAGFEGGRSEPLRAVAADLFIGGPLPATRFIRDRRGRVMAVELTSRGVRALRFHRRPPLGGQRKQ